MKTIRSRILLSFTIMLLGFVVVFTSLYYLNLRRTIIGGFDKRLRSHAEDIAGLLDVEIHERLRDPEQMASVEYRQLYAQFRSLVRKGDLAYIFTIRSQNGRWVYVMDSGEGEDHLLLGTAYNEGKPLDPDETAALAGRTVVSSVYTSKYGTFKSAYTPLYDANGQIVGLLVVDIEASTIAATMRTRLLHLLGIELGLLILTVLAAGAVSNSITKPLHRMAMRARRISEGDLDAPMATDRQDEIGTVARSIDEMVDRLKEMIGEKEKVAGELARFNQSLGDLVEERTRALADSESRYRFLTEQALIGIFLLQNGRFRFVNATMADFLGFSREDLMYREFTSIIHPDDRERVRDDVRQRILGSEEQLRCTFRVITSEGATRTIELFGARMEYEGQPAIYGTAQDITEQKRLEEMLQRSQRLEGLGQIAGGIAHEFNNLLSPIVGYTALLQNRLAQLERSDLTRPLAMIEKASGRATDLVNEILTFARKTDYQLSPVDLNDVVEETLALLKKTIPRTITIEKDLEKDLPLVEAEAGQIQSALLNLCLNARDAMPEGGRLTLTSRTVTVGDELRHLEAHCPDGRCVQVSIQDSGVGIDEETLTKIFDPFFTTKKESGGSGLGLATVYGTVQSHRGHLAVVSTPREGSTFSIYLPVTERQLIPRTRPSAHLPRGSERLLVVEDDEDVRSLYTDLLEDLGYAVIEAGDGQEALQLLAGNSIELIVLDINMPRMDGHQALAEIRRINSALPVLIVSGLGTLVRKDFDGDRHLRFVAKPFRIEEVAQVLRELLDDAPPGIG